MKKQFLTGALIAGTLATASVAFADPASALQLVGSASTTNENPNVPVTVTISDIADGVNIMFQVDESLGTTGDLLSSFFNFADTFTDTASLSVQDMTGNVVDFFLDSNGTPGNTGLGGNIGATFDLAAVLSETGSSSGLLKTTKINVFGNGLDVTDFFNQDFAVRLQTVGPAPNGGTGSSKQTGTFGSTPTTPIPTPAAVLPGLMGMGAAVFRKKKQEGGVEQEA